MISPFEIEGRPRPLRERPVSELMARVRVEVGGMHFASTDRPSEVETVEEDPSVQEAACRRVEAAALAEESRLRLEEARAEGVRAARRDFEVELEAKLAEERLRLDRLRTEFARDRQRFFAAAEGQVVKLALAVARRILHRDAMVEGLPLRATVKAALARVQDESSTVLRVPPSEVGAWREMFVKGTAGKIDVEGDQRMAEGECSLQTKVGGVALGVQAQMEEVERGFAELTQDQGY